jgi:hypothetical protein
MGYTMPTTIVSLNTVLIVFGVVAFVILLIPFVKRK